MGENTLEKGFVTPFQWIKGGTSEELIGNELNTAKNFYSHRNINIYGQSTKPTHSTWVSKKRNMIRGGRPLVFLRESMICSAALKLPKATESKRTCRRHTHHLFSSCISETSWNHLATGSQVAIQTFQQNKGRESNRHFYPMTTLPVFSVT